MQKGFTIVELLIVIVVIAILAAISIVSYTGVQERARLTVAQNDLRSLWQAAEVFRLDNGRYPLVPNSSTGVATEIEGILRSTELYWKTRGVESRRYMFCGTESGDSLAIASDLGDLYGKTPSAMEVGMKFSYASQGGVTEGRVSVLPADLPEAGSKIRAVCASIDESFSVGELNRPHIRWSHDIPTYYADAP